MRGGEMNYLTVTQTGKKWGISSRRVIVLCNENRVLGAQKLSASWIVPENAEKPADARIRSGRYVRLKTEEERMKTDAGK